MILNEGQPEAWRVHTIDDAAPTLYAERPPAILGRSLHKKVLLFENHATDSRCRPIDIAMTMGATRNGSCENNNPLVVFARRRVSK